MKYLVFVIFFLTLGCQPDPSKDRTDGKIKSIADSLLNKELGIQTNRFQSDIRKIEGKWLVSYSDPDDPSYPVIVVEIKENTYQGKIVELNQ